MWSFKIIALIILMCIWSSTKVALPDAEECNLNSGFFTDTDMWNISHNTIPVEILWQKSEVRTRPNFHLGSPNTGLVASKDIVVYWQPTGVSSCDQTPFVAGFDTQTGVERWRYRPLDGIVTKVFLVKDGFILLNTSSITKLDSAGKIVWQNSFQETIPYRAFTTMYEVGSFIFLPALYGKIYEFSVDTGDLIQTIDDYNVMGFWGDYALFKVADNELQLRTLDSESEILYTIQLPNSIFQNTPLNPIFPFVKRDGDILFLFFEGSRVEAYNFFTGKLLWQNEVPMYGTPAFVGNFLAIYRLDQTLEIHDPATGNIVASTELKQDQANSLANTYTSSPFSIWITGNSDTVFIRQIDELELLALKLDTATFPG
jgi:outer membrane protein assembly factor BamB